MIRGYHDDVSRLPSTKILNLRSALYLVHHYVQNVCFEKSTELRVLFSLIVDSIYRFGFSPSTSSILDVNLIFWCRNDEISIYFGTTAEIILAQ